MGGGARGRRRRRREKGEASGARVGFENSESETGESGREESGREERVEERVEREIHKRHRHGNVVQRLPQGEGEEVDMNDEDLTCLLE